MLNMPKLIRDWKRVRLSHSILGELHDANTSTGWKKELDKVPEMNDRTLETRLEVTCTTIPVYLYNSMAYKRFLDLFDSFWRTSS